MNTYKLLTLSLLILLLTSKTSVASHAMGADLTYRCIGPGLNPGSFQYEITYSFYRDCSGIPAPPAPALVITNSCGYTIPTINLTATVGSPIQISPVCPTTVTTCNGGSFTGIEEWIYTSTVLLPGPCHDWTFSHSESARNAAITTFTGGGGDLYVYSVLNNTNSICNNSPTFNNRPVPLLCVGQQFCFNNGTYDIDGDSLTFQIITPRNGPLPSDTVDYATGYSATQPLISNPPMIFNPLTGEFCVTPAQTDVSPLAILVNEFRNGILIGQVERDLQLTVFACSNILPILTGYNGTSDYTESVCFNKQNCFYIPSVDPDLSNITNISWDHSIPNATLTTLGGNRDTAIFCWTPTSADTISNPYCFTVTVQDDNCPYLGIQTFTYCLTIDTTFSCIPLQVKSFENNYSGLKIYPQPASRLLTIDFGNDFLLNENHQLRILNILGETVFQSMINEKILTIDLQDWSTGGIYIACLLDKNGGLLKREKFAVVR